MRDPTIVPYIDKLNCLGIVINNRTNYINELAAVLGRCNVIVKLFADDLKMYAVMKTAFHADMFQHALDRLATWADEW